ncbi:zinc ABC transporter substrate-binding protein [Tropicimonas marinistellae]|uniref:zinc ABC transporter substrate-binding protein n=1 Tax=Tropicimonas marinistellae TaxID=1739787 RepID=UPI00082C41F3|nr:zinc ABC transporter substrate-binding protein [Tropicimonas marinistellae]
MRRNLLLATVSALGVAGGANADTPSVAADIPPVHSLVAMVMDGVGSPDLLVQPGASPHGYALRPSEAQALEKADVVFWVGEALEPWLEGSIETLAADATVVELMESEGTTELEFREGATFEKHTHDDDEHHDDHDEDEHADGEEDHHGEEGTAEHEGEDHGHEEAGHEDHHDHHGHDPHGWLDPENGRAWLDVIADELSKVDPDNAETYRSNTEAGKARIEAAIDQVIADLAPVQGRDFIVFHDAYQYFENRFDVAAAGSISLGDASDPSPARIKEIRDKVQELGVSCVFSEPQFNPGLVRTVFQGTDAKTGILDPLGTDLDIGPDLYPLLLENLGTNLADCLK